VWLGSSGTTDDLFEEAAIPHFATEADAVQGFMHIVRYREAQALLMETPPSLPEDFAPETDKARGVVAGAVAEGRSWLDPLEVTALFEAYGLPITPAVLAQSADEAGEVARPFLEAGDPVAIK